MQPAPNARAPQLVSVTGGRLVEYLSVGTGAPVILSSPSWWPLDPWLLAGIPELEEGFRVIAFNHRGVGRSQATPTSYSVASLANDLLTLMDALDVSSAHLVGFAIGAVIAMQAAVQNRERVRSLVMGAAGPGEAKQPGRPLPPGSGEDVRRLGYRTFIREHALNEQAFGQRTRVEHPERPEALAEALWRHAGSEEEFLKHARARQGHRTLEGAVSVRHPTLVMVGAEDFAARGPSTPAALAPHLADRLPNGRLELIPGVRHMLFWDQPEVVWPRVLSFLEGLPAQVPRIPTCDSR